MPNYFSFCCSEPAFSKFAIAKPAIAGIRAVLLALFALTAISIQALAAETTVRFTGNINFVKTSAINGITTADPLSLTITYEEDAVAATGTSILVFGTPAAPMLRLQVGPHEFREQQDLDFGSGFPNMRFVDGVAVAVNMVVVDAIDSPLSDLDVRDNSVAVANDIDGPLIRGTIDYASREAIVLAPTKVPTAPVLALAVFAVALTASAFRSGRQPRRSL